MQRQDEFLRRLLELANEGEFGDIIELLEERLPLLKPVAYENRDLSSGLSWNGNIICGDQKSIRAVQQALHLADQVETFWRPTYKQMSERLNVIIDALK